MTMMMPMLMMTTCVWPLAMMTMMTMMMTTVLLVAPMVRQILSKVSKHCLSHQQVHRDSHSHTAARRSVWYCGNENVKNMQFELAGNRLPPTISHETVRLCMNKERLRTICKYSRQGALRPSNRQTRVRLDCNQVAATTVTTGPEVAVGGGNHGHCLRHTGAHWPKG